MGNNDILEEVAESLNNSYRNMVKATVESTMIKVVLPNENIAVFSKDGDIWSGRIFTPEEIETGEFFDTFLIRDKTTPLDISNGFMLAVLVYKPFTTGLVK